MKVTLMLVLGGLLSMTVSFEAGPCAGGRSHADTGAMTVPRAAHQATVLETGDVLITGGCDSGCNTRHRSAELYSPDSATFLPVADMHEARTSHAALRLADGRVLISGGWVGSRVSDSVESFDSETRRFTALSNMTAARAGHAAVLLADGRVLVIGGERATGASLASTEFLDPVTTRFTAGGTMSVPRASHAVVRLQDGRVLVTGGHSARDDVLRSAEVFDPATGRFERVGDMQLPRHKHAAVRLQDGRVLIVGGSDARDYRGLYRSTEIFDPATNTFGPGPDMRWPRHKIVGAVTVLPSGKVLVAGGAERPEILDPASMTFSDAGHSQDGEAMFATATLLDDGSVLVAGGYDDRIEATRKTWIYREQ